ncbi:MAG TPA: ATPase, T2SS/T4P/T4SS family [Pirellulales bacterium]|jgi:type II secretory ATPase GspE/PulE/Tfp pilus assembly ATPase PilB-like protein
MKRSLTLKFSLLVLAAALWPVVGAQAQQPNMPGGDYPDPDGFSITYPEGWIAINKESAAKLPAGQKAWLATNKINFDAVRVVLVHAGGKDFLEYVTVGVKPKEVPISDADLPGFVQGIKDEYKKANIELENADYHIADVGGTKGYQLEYTVKAGANATPLRIRLDVVPGGGKTYSLTFTSTQDQFGSMQSVFDQMLTSFHGPRPRLSDHGWPNYPLPAPTKFGTDHEHGRGTGFYISLFKVLMVWLLFVLWVKTTDWVSQDCLRVNLNYVLWNSVVFFTFIAAFVLIWIIPMFEVALPLLLVAYLAPLGTFVIIRNKAVPNHQRVLTPSHIRHMISRAAGLFGMKVANEKQADWQKGPPVNFKGKTGGGRDAEANLLLARRSPGYVPAKTLAADLLNRRGDAAMMEFNAANVSVRFQIDGVWHNAEPLEREPGTLVLAVIKTLAGLDAQLQTKRQDGSFTAEFKGANFLCRVNTQPAEGGERAVWYFHPTKTPIMTLEELGMRPKTQEQLKELVGRSKGLVVISAMPQAGLSSLFDGVLKSCDRYMRDFASVEDVGFREHDIENLQVTTYNPAAKETAVQALDKVVRTYPNVIVMRTLPDGETAKVLCEQYKEDRLVLTGLRAKDATESLLRVMMLKVPPQDFVNAISGAVCVRLIRKLCDECKESYPAPADVLQQFGIPPGKVQTLFRPPSEPDPKRACPNCQGLGYKGRTGLFELLVVDDALREVLLKSPKLDLVRAAARRGGMKTFQEEGLVLVVKGVTSLVELQRVLKG